MPNTAEHQLPIVAEPLAEHDATPERMMQLVEAVIPNLIEMLEHYAAQHPEWTAKQFQHTERLRAITVRAHPLTTALKQTGGVYGPDEVQKLLGVSRQALHKQRQRRTILALRVGANAFVYPVIQFTEVPGGWRVHPDVPAVLQEGAFLVPDELFVFLATPQPALQEATGWDRLRAARASDVLALLRHWRGRPSAETTARASGHGGGDVLPDVPTEEAPVLEVAVVTEGVLARPAGASLRSATVPQVTVRDVSGGKAPTARGGSRSRLSTLHTIGKGRRPRVRLVVRSSTPYGAFGYLDPRVSRHDPTHDRPRAPHDASSKA